MNFVISITGVLSFQLGERHVHYGSGMKFRPIFWDIFTLSMTQVLEKRTKVNQRQVEQISANNRSVDACWILPGTRKSERIKIN